MVINFEGSEAEWDMIENSDKIEENSSVTVNFNQKIN